MMRNFAAIDFETANHEAVAFAAWELSLFAMVKLSIRSIR